MDSKKTSIFGSNLFPRKKSESENKTESPAATNSNDSEYLWISRLTTVEKQNQEISRKFDEMKRQNDKLICQNEIILEMLETQMKLFLDLKSGHDGATTTFPIANTRNISDHPQTLAISNPLYKFNTNTNVREKTGGEELPVGNVINQEPATGKRQLLALGRRQEKTKEKQAALIEGGKQQAEQQTTSRKQDEESESEVARSPRPQNEREVREKTRSSRQYQRSKAVWQAIKLAILSFHEIRIWLRLSSGCEASLFKNLGIAGAAAWSSEYLADQTGGRDLHVFSVDGGSEKTQYREKQATNKV